MQVNSKAERIRTAKEILFMCLGVISACFGLKSFLMPEHFIDGGVTGISLLISTLSEWKLSYLIIVINIPFIILGYKQIGPVFALKTAIAITALSLCLIFIPFQPITHEKVLVAFLVVSFWEAELAWPCVAAV